MPGSSSGAASIRPALRAAKFVTDWATSTPQQLALAQFIDRSWFSRHLRAMRALYLERHQLISAIVEQDLADVFDVIPSAAGLHLSVLTRGVDADEATARLADGATSAGVAAYSLGTFGTREPRPSGVVIGYGAIEVTDIPEGMRRLGRLFA